MIQHQADCLLMSELMGSGEKCPQVDRAQLTGAGCWYSTRVFLIHICNVEQCSKLFRQGSSRLLFGPNLAYHDNFIIGLLHRSSGLPSPCLSYSLTEFTRQSDLPAVQRSGCLWWLEDISKLNSRCCWHQTTVMLLLAQTKPGTLIIISSTFCCNNVVMQLIVNPAIPLWCSHCHYTL